MSSGIGVDSIVDVDKGIGRWSRIPKKAGVDFRFKLAHKCFNRQIGTFAMWTASDVHISPDGRVISDAEWTKHSTDWLPSAADHDHIQNLMQRVVEPGKMASYIAPPARGIGNQELEFEYIRL